MGAPAAHPTCEPAPPEQRVAVRRRCSSSACSAASSLENGRFPCWTQCVPLIPPIFPSHHSVHLRASSTEEVFRSDRYFPSKTYSCTCHCSSSLGRWDWGPSISPCPTSDISFGCLFSFLHERRGLTSELEKPHKFL